MTTEQRLLELLDIKDREIQSLTHDVMEARSIETFEREMRRMGFVKKKKEADKGRKEEGK